ncbi:hypothetical protein E3T40_14915 [Cryobacterium sp. TMT1-19]|nr:hypothetical protein E3T40_14915 [Cryobacterium sp. TMT1-19]
MGPRPTCGGPSSAATSTRAGNAPLWSRIAHRAALSAALPPGEYQISAAIDLFTDAGASLVTGPPAGLTLR